MNNICNQEISINGNILRAIQKSDWNKVMVQTFFALLTQCRNNEGTISFNKEYLEKVFGEEDVSYYKMKGLTKPLLIGNEKVVLIDKVKNKYGAFCFWINRKIYDYIGGKKSCRIFVNDIYRLKTIKDIRLYLLLKVGVWTNRFNCAHNEEYECIINVRTEKSEICREVKTEDYCEREIKQAVLSLISYSEGIKITSVENMKPRGEGLVIVIKFKIGNKTTDFEEISYTEKISNFQTRKESRDEKIRKLHELRLSNMEIAERLNISTRTVTRALHPKKKSI